MRALPGLHWGIRARVTVVASIVVALALLIAGAAIVLVLRASLLAGVDAAQASRADALAAQLVRGPVPASIPEPRDRPAMAQIVGPSGRVVASTPNADGESALLESPPRPRRAGAFTITDTPIADDADARVYALPVRVSGGPGWIYVASSLTPVDSAVASLASSLAVGIPVLIAVLAAVLWRSVSTALRPVGSMRRRAAEIGGGDLSRRIPEPAGSDEIRGLAETLNQMLGRLEESAARQSRFVADASHELRSPLTALRTEVDTAVRPEEDAEWAGHLGRVGAQVDRMIQLTEDLLLLARRGESGSGTDEVDLDEVVIAEVAAVAAVARHPVRLGRLSAARVVGSRRDLERVVRNLLANADAHAAAEVVIALVADEADAVLTVTDDGPGVPVPDRERVFDRFVRLEPSRERPGSRGGWGLGLAIVREIVLAHRGTVLVRDRADARPGAEFVVALPLDRG